MLGEPKADILESCARGNFETGLVGFRRRNYRGVAICGRLRRNQPPRIHVEGCVGRARKRGRHRLELTRPKSSNSSALRRRTRSSLSAGAGRELLIQRLGGPLGVAMPTGNLRGWKQVFADDFPSSEDAPLGSFKGCSFTTRKCEKLPAATSAKWFAYPDGVPDTWGGGRYTPSQVASIHGGVLDLHLHTSPETGVHEVAALVPRIPTSTGLRGTRYGAYAVRFRASSLPGYEAAFQLWPDSQNGLHDGEIGFPAGPLSKPVEAWSHWQDATSESMNYEFPTRTQFSGWHTAVIEREPGRLRFILDGRVVALVTRHLPATPMYWVLQTEVEQSPNLPSADVSGNVDVAWATAYAWDPKSADKHTG